MKTSAALPLPSQTTEVNVSTDRKRPWRWLAIALWLAIAVVTTVVYWQPVRSQSVRVELITGSVVLWLGALLIIRHKVFRITAAVLPILLMGLLMLPGRAPNKTELRNQYVRALLSYAGTRYIWGGETRRGIDCSGLIRAGLISAQWRQGFATHNPALMREAISLAWHDTSARAMRDEHRGQTRLLFRAKGIDRIDSSKLLPGDFAVTSDGIHTLAYVGNNTWIEAEPGEKVIVLKADTDNPWLKIPVHVLRWRQLE